MSWLYHMNGSADAAMFQWNICSINRSCPDWKSDTQTHMPSKRFYRVYKVNGCECLYYLDWFYWLSVYNETSLLKETPERQSFMTIFLSISESIQNLFFLSIWAALISGMLAISPHTHSLFLWKATVTLCWSMKAGSGPSSHSITLNIQQRLHNIGKLFTS